MGSDQVLGRIIFRRLVRLTQRFDAKPAAKALLWRPPAGGSTQADEGHRLYAGALHEVFGSPEALYMTPEQARSVSLRSIVSSSARNKAFSTDAKLNAGFAALRALGDKWATAKDMRMGIGQPSESSVRAERANELKTGIYLLAHPLLHERFFHRTVILLSSYSREGGASGLIVNRHTSALLSGALMEEKTSEGGTNTEPSAIPFLTLFGNNSLRIGGPKRRLQWLHCHDDVGGQALPCWGEAADASPTVYLGGDLAVASQLVKEGAVQPQDFRLVFGACLWSPGQLEREMQEGSWSLVQASPSLALSEEDDLWHSLMRAVHGEFAGLPPGAIAGFDQEDTISSCDWST